MKKKKIKADSVEQLMEIVRAIQNGEEPEEALRRKEAESAPEADSPKSHPEPDDGEEKVGPGHRRKKAKAERRAKSREDWDAEEDRKAKDAGLADHAKRREDRDAEEDRKAKDAGLADHAKRREDRDAEEDRKTKDAGLADYAKRREDRDADAFDDFDDDDFERNLEKDAQRSVNFAPLQKNIREGAGRVAGFFRKLKPKKKAEADEAADAAENAPEADFSDWDEAEAQETTAPRTKLWGKTDSPEQPMDAKAAPEEDFTDWDEAEAQETTAPRTKPWGKTDSSEQPMDVKAVPEEEFTDWDEAEAKETTAPRTKLWGKTDSPEQPTNAKAAPEEDFTDWDESDATPEELERRREDALAIDRILDQGAQPEADADGRAPEKHADSDANGTTPEKPAGSDVDGTIPKKYIGGDTDKTSEKLTGDPADKAPEESSEKGSQKRRVKLPKLSLQSVKDGFRELPEKLAQRGIHKKELLMIGAGAVLLLLIVVLIVNAVGASVETKRKSQNVTADEGLTVTVEKEPEDWCSSYPVELGFRASGAAVSRVVIDGNEYVPDANGRVTLTALTDVLEARAYTEQGELSARIELPMIDAQKPVVNVAREKEQITVSAADAKSSVAGIWYAAVKDGDFMELPLYRPYKDPLLYEEKTTYYFYAKDKAGNQSAVTATTTEPAQELLLTQEKLSLYPGETKYLSMQVEPAGALLNNLKYESANPEVAAVDGNGAVTALGEGSTLVSVSSDGLEAVSCEVEVSKERTVTISAVGDCTLGTDENFNTSTSFDAFDAVNGHSYFFQNVRDILENDDATFANLEGTFTTETTREAKQYAFKGDPSYTEIVQSGSIEVVTLANNHSSDYGEKSLADTKQYLTDAQIDYCTGDEIAMRDVNGIRTAFIGIYVLNDGMAREDQVRDTIAAAKEQGAQLVVMGFHWGSEKETAPDETQQALAHLAVDCGADLVVGHHPHVLQGIENYNGKYIVYSLGNFCFGGNSTPSDMDTIIFRQTFTVAQDGVLPDGAVEVIPCKISSADGYNNYQPTPAQGTEAERIIGRVNEYSSAYGQSFTASTGL